MRATRTFDPAKGAFSTHAQVSILAYVCRGTRYLGSIGRFGTSKQNASLRAHAHKVTPPGGVLSREWAEEILQQPLTDSEYETVVGMLSGSHVSLSRPSSDDEHAPSKADNLPDTVSATPEEYAIAGEWMSVLRTVRDGLRGVEASVFDLRLLPAAEEPLSLSDLGHMHGLSKERVRQIEAVVRRRIRIAATSAGLLQP